MIGPQERILQTMLEAETWRSLLLSLLAEVLLPDPDCEAECSEMMGALLEKARMRYLAEPLPEHIDPQAYGLATEKALICITEELAAARQARARWRQEMQPESPVFPIAQTASRLAR